MDLDFIFDKRSLPARELQTPASFRNWIEFGDHRTTVWGVDPGVTDVFVAVDGHGEDQHVFAARPAKSSIIYVALTKPQSKEGDGVSQTGRTGIN